MGTNLISLTIREMDQADRELWTELYGFLWPHYSQAAFLREIDRILVANNRLAIVAEYRGQAVGFAEYAERAYANGCISQPVPFLEGIWVHETYRRRGVAAELLNWLESHAKARGFDEMGSDVEIGNEISEKAHQRWGFAETERVIYYRKGLT